MAYSQSDLDALQASIAKGARRVRIGPEEVEFRSLDEMLKLERRMKAELGLDTGGRLFTPQTSSGWR